MRKEKDTMNRNDTTMFSGTFCPLSALIKIRKICNLYKSEVGLRSTGMSSEASILFRVGLDLEIN